MEAMIELPTIQIIGHVQLRWLGFPLSPQPAISSPLLQRVHRAPEKHGGECLPVRAHPRPSWNKGGVSGFPKEKVLWLFEV